MLPPPVQLQDPHDARDIDGERLLVTDAQLELVIEVDWFGHVSRVVGGPKGALRLSDPHSAQLLPGGEILICDSGADRLVWAGVDGSIVTAIVRLADGRSVGAYAATGGIG